MICKRLGSGDISTGGDQCYGTTLAGHSQCTAKSQGKCPFVLCIYSSIYPTTNLNNLNSTPATHTIYTVMVNEMCPPYT